MNGTKRLAVAAVALLALLTTVGLAGAGSYTPGLEADNPAPGDGQDCGHRGVPGDIPALPDGYDQAVVDTSAYGSPPGFGSKALRVSNANSEATAEFEYQTYSAPTPDPAGETQANKVFDGTFQFRSTSAAHQPGLNVSVSPDNGHGARMSFVSLEDTPSGIKITFFDAQADGSFRAHEVGTYSRTDVHTVRFLIETVPGQANDVLRLFVDGVDIGERDGLCFTTWESYYRVNEGHEPGVIDSLQFRTANGWDCAANGATKNGATCVVAGLLGGGYLFDNVTTTTRDTGGPAPTTCSAVGRITPTGTTCQQYVGGTGAALAQVLYTGKGGSINAVSPGVFFYYTKVSGTAGQSVEITQTNDAVTAPVVPIQNGQVLLYSASTCKALKWNPTITSGTASGTLPSSGDFVIGVKYSPADLKGKAQPNPDTVTYSFGTKLGGVVIGVDAASVELAPKK